jgi:hypothetical protein
VILTFISSKDTRIGSSILLTNPFWNKEDRVVTIIYLTDGNTTEVRGEYANGNQLLLGENGGDMILMLLKMANLIIAYLIKTLL